MLGLLLACAAADSASVAATAAAAALADTSTDGSAFLSITPSPVSLAYTGELMDRCETESTSDELAEARTEGTVAVRNVSADPLSFALTPDEHGLTCVEEAPRVSV